MTPIRMTPFKSKPQPLKKYKETRSIQYEVLKKKGLLNKKLVHIKMNFSEKNIQCLRKASSKMTSVQQIYLNYDDCDQNYNDSFRNLRFLLKKFKHLKNLDINLALCDKLTDKGILNLQQSLQIQSLASLKLNFDSCKKLSDKALQYIQQSVKKLRNLNTFSINMSECEKVSDTGLLCLENCLLRTHNLQSFQLKAKRCPKIGDDGVKRLFNALRKLKKIQSLDLSIEGCNKVTDSSMQILQKYFQHTINLKTLALNLTGCELSSQGISQLEDGILKANDLNKVKLHVKELFDVPKSQICGLQRRLKMNKSFQSIHIVYV